jgi:hypothetical protein
VDLKIACVRISLANKLKKGSFTMFVAVAALNQAALFGALIVFAVMGLGSLFVVLKDVQDNLPQTAPWVATTINISCLFVECVGIVIAISVLVLGARLVF